MPTHEYVHLSACALMMIKDRIRQLVEKYTKCTCISQTNTGVSALLEEKNLFHGVWWSIESASMVEN